MGDNALGSRVKGSDPRAVDNYIAGLPHPQRDIVHALRKIIKSTVLGVEERLAWGKPWYFCDGMLCCIMPCKTRVNFLFPKGKLLGDPDHLLEGSGKTMRHVKIRCARDVSRIRFTRWLKQAARLNVARPCRAGRCGNPRG